MRSTTRSDRVDYNLSDGQTGAMAIERVRKACEIAALIVSGDAVVARALEFRTGQYQSLHKPVNVVVLQALLRQMLQRETRSSKG